jgi:C4-dicarboxylate-specific signal transduction histidine kinase
MRYADALWHEALGYVLARSARQCGFGEAMPPGWSLSPVRQKEEETLMTREPDLETVNRALGETVRKLQKDLADADRRIRRLREELAEAHRAAAIAAGRDW